MNDRLFSWKKDSLQLVRIYKSLVKSDKKKSSIKHKINIFAILQNTIKYFFRDLFFRAYDNLIANYI